MDGDPPIAVQVIHGPSGDHVAGLNISVYEVLGDGSTVWQASGVSDQDGRVDFHLDGLDGTRIYRLRSNPMGAGPVFSHDLDTAGPYVYRVGTSPVTVTDGITGLPLVGLRVTAFRLEQGNRVWYKEGYAGVTGTVHFDFESLEDDIPVMVEVRNPFGQGVTYDSDLIEDEGPVAFAVGASSEPEPEPEPGPGPGPGPAPFQCQPTPAPADAYYVATDGHDWSGDGTLASPWATIEHALLTVPDGATILVRPGTYTGTTRLRGNFTTGVVVRSEVPYAARLRASGGKAVYCYNCAGITLEGFDIAHSGPGDGPLVVQLQGPSSHDLVVRNNIIHDSYDNDLLKVNNGASNVLVERNLFYNQWGSDEHIDINSVVDVVVQDNVFLNDYAASGRSNANSTSSYIVIKDSNGAEDQYVGAERVTIRRNVFLNWQGGNGYNYVLVGEDAAPYIEARDILVENNLMLGNSPHEMRSPLGVKSGQDVVFRNNTVSGDLPSRAFAMRLNVENPALQNHDVQFFNNIYSDPTGTMTRFSNTPIGETATFELDNNLYWNDGAAVPHNSYDMVNRADDASGLDLDPLLVDPASASVPTWNGTSFSDGSSDICAAFDTLVETYGRPAATSPVIDAARPDQAPDHDIRGQPRTAADIGAYEVE